MTPRTSLVSSARRVCAAAAALLILAGACGSCGPRNHAPAVSVGEYLSSDYNVVLRSGGVAYRLELNPDSKFHFSRKSVPLSPSGLAARTRVAFGTWSATETGARLRFRVIYAEIDAGRPEDLFGKGDRTGVIVEATYADGVLRFRIPEIAPEELLLHRVR